MRAGLLVELGSQDPRLADALTLSSDEMKALLDLARDVAHESGARQYAPLATYLAGRLVQARGADAGVRLDLITALARAAEAAGPAGDESA